MDTNNWFPRALRIGSDKVLRKSAAILLLLASVTPVFAHHGMAAFDSGWEVTVEGTVVEFDFVNPHALLNLKVDVAGNASVWQGEMTSPNRLARAGWTRSSLKPGDRVTMTGYPSKSNTEAMWIRRILVNGRELNLNGTGE